MRNRQSAGGNDIRSNGRTVIQNYSIKSNRGVSSKTVGTQKEQTINDLGASIKNNKWNNQELEESSSFNFVKIKEAEFPQVAQRPDSKTIGEAHASFTNSIPFKNIDAKINI